MLLVRPIGHPPRLVPPRAAGQRSRAYPTLLRALRWGRYGHRGGGGQTPGVGSLASVSFGLLSPRPPPVRCVGPRPPAFHSGVSPFPRSFLLSQVPAVPCLPPAFFPRSGTLFVGSRAGFRLPGAPTACRSSLPPALWSLLRPPHVPMPSPRRLRPLPGRVGVRWRGGRPCCLSSGTCTLRARCRHEARHWPAGRGCPLLGLPARFGSSLSPSVGGGVSRVAPFVALRTLCPYPWHVPPVGGKHGASTLRGTALLYLVLSLLPPHPSSLSVGGTPSSSPSSGGWGVGGGGGGACCLFSGVCTLRARCKHEARHLSAVGGLPARFGSSLSPSVGGGGLAVWPSSAPFVPCVPASGNEHAPSIGGKHCASTLRGTVLLYLFFSLLPPHQATLSIGGTHCAWQWGSDLSLVWGCGRWGGGGRKVHARCEHVWHDDALSLGCGSIPQVLRPLLPLGGSRHVSARCSVSRACSLLCPYLLEEVHTWVESEDEEVRVVGRTYRTPRRLLA